jgi:hypothetical protein
MSILVILLFLTKAGDIDGSIAVGVANGQAACVVMATEAIKAHADEVKKLVDSGLTPQLHCVSARSLADKVTTAL